MSSVVNVKPTNVFPTTKLNSINKLITEGNITKLLNSILDTDSYIIPPADLSFDSDVIWDNNLQGLIKVPDLTLSHLECVLHGYYFDLGPIFGENAIAPQLTTNSSLLLGQIIIDTTNENYPELFGEESTDPPESIQVTLPNIWRYGDTDAPTINPNYRDLNIKTIYATASGTSYYFNLNSNWELVALQNIPLGTEFTSYTIEYITYYSLIKLHLLTGEEAKIPTDTPYFGNTIEPLGNNYISVTLPLLCRQNNQIYFPMTSFPKFTSTSIYSIDGGLI